MDTLRKPLEGIGHIVRFNWHLYALAGGMILCMLAAGLLIWPSIQIYALIACLLITLPICSSLIVSLYVYDLSTLYTFDWLDPHINEPHTLVNIHAGFDECSKLLIRRFPNAKLQVFDFYDPVRHTEISIKRARRAYPPFPGTLPISTGAIPLENKSTDTIFLILAAHEIRDEKERLAFFRELKRILKPHGRIVVTEHLRDLPNFLAYSVGFFHFIPGWRWLKAFRESGLRLESHFQITPFIHTFIVCH